MMKKKFQPLYGTLLIFFISLIFSACHKSSNPGLAYVPKDANVVISFNIKQLHEKLKDGKFNVDSLMNEIKTQDSAFALLPYLNLKDPILTYVRYKSSITMGSDVLVGSVGQLDDRAAFEKELGSLYPDKKVEKQDDYSYLSVSNDDALVWNDNIIAFYHVKDATTQVASLFKLKSDASLSNDKNAEKILGNQGDIVMFTNSQDDLSGIPMLSMTKISDLIKGNYGGLTVNFEKGEVKVEGNFFYNKTLEELIKKNPAGKLNQDVLAHFPGKPIGLFQFAINLKQIFSFLDYAGVTSMVEGYMKNIGITLDDIAKAFSGNVGGAMQSTSGATLNPQTPKMLFVIPIADKTSFDKVMGAFEKMGLVEQANGQWAIKAMSANEQYAFQVSDKAIVISSDKTLSETYLSGQGKIEYPEHIDLSGKTFVLYTDLDKVISGISEMDDSPITQLAQSTFEDVDMSASQLKGSESSMDMTFRLKDKASNSLPVLVSFFQQMNELDKARKSANLNPPTVVDSVQVPVPLPPDLEDEGN